MALNREKTPTEKMIQSLLIDQDLNKIKSQDHMRQRINEIVLFACQEQRKICHDAWKDKGKSRFSNFHAKKTAAAILNADHPMKKNLYTNDVTVKD